MRERRLLAGASARLAGRAFVERHSDLFDAALSSLWLEALDVPEKPSGRMALVALGGYGRRELCPHSDIDLMILHAGRRTDQISAAAEAVFYPLWNVGLDVGHATRSVKDCVSLVAAEFESATTLLDARLVAGDLELFSEMTTAVKRRISRKRRKFVADSRASLRARWASYGEGAYVLEPQVKEGCGGLRDVHQLMWIAKVFTESGSIEGLADNLELSAHNRDLLLQALNWLLTARVNLHCVAERRTDRLYTDLQQELAARLGYPAAEDFSPAEHFMRDYHERAAQIKHISTLFWSRLDSPGRRVLNPGLTGLTARADPAAALSAFAGSIEAGRELEPETVESHQVALAGSSALIDWSPQSRTDFMGILGAGEAGCRCLETMNDIGLMSRLLPHWDKIRYRPSSGPFHHYTVDMHSFRAVAELSSQTGARPDGAGELPRRLADEIERPDTLLLATLLHDIGKGADGHSERGAQVAEEICRRTGLTDDADTVAFLVRNHLLLSETSTRRDITESHLLEAIAEQLVTPDRLKMLYLLSVADSVATGPAAWTDWKAALLRELFFNVLHTMETEEGVRVASQSPASQAREDARAGLPAGRVQDLEAFLEQLPDSYFAGSSADAIHLHLDLVASANEGEIRTLARAARTGDAVEFSIAAPDTPGLLSKAAGVLALHSRDILAAQTYSLPDGIALQIFLTAGYFDQAPEAADWPSISRDLELALSGRMAIDYRLARKLEAYQRRGKRGGRPEVVVDNEASSSRTVIEVHAPDRIGLLYSIAKALHDLELNILIAKVSTNADRAIDVFYVVDAAGAKIVDAAHIQEVRRSIEHHLERV